MKKTLFLAGLMSVLVSTSTGAVFAKEIGSGGAPSPVACSPINSLAVKGDARVSDSAASSIQAGWTVKPCTNGQDVQVFLEIVDWNTKATIYTDTNVSANGKLTLGVERWHSYQVKITVIDTATGMVIGATSAFASTIPKGV